LRRLIASLALIGGLSLTAGAWADDGSSAPSAASARLDQLARQIGAGRQTRPPRDNEDVERAGRKALRQHGAERLYGLWRL